MIVHTIENSFQDENMETCCTKVAKALSKSNRCIVVTGAGISCSAGIPDFRSSTGLYNLSNSKNPKSQIKGKDIFDANLFRCPEATDFFYRFMGEFKTIIKNCKYTKAHGFIKRLHDSCKLLRCYTQNIDDLEDRLTLNMDLMPDPQKAQVVQLHGSMSRVVCTLSPSCHNFDFSTEYEENFKNGEPPKCPKCEDAVRERAEKGKRQCSSGTLRPDIVLYNEFHPLGDVIGELQCRDLRKRPDFLLIMGTSLKIPGCKKLIKEAAKSVHSLKNGLVVFVNLTEVGGEWDEIIDYHFKCSTDDWVQKIEPLFLKLYKPKIKNHIELPRSSSAIVQSTSNQSFLSKQKVPPSEFSDDNNLDITGVPSSLGSFKQKFGSSPFSLVDSFENSHSQASLLKRSASVSPILPFKKPYTFQSSKRSDFISKLDKKSSLCLENQVFSDFDACLPSVDSKKKCKSERGVFLIRTNKNSTDSIENIKTPLGISKTTTLSKSNYQFIDRLNHKHNNLTGLEATFKSSEFVLKEKNKNMPRSSVIKKRNRPSF